MFTAQDVSVKFGQSIDMGLEAMQAFPFFYNFISYENDQWDGKKGTDEYSPLLSVGPIVPPSSSIRHVIRLDPDHNFKLLWTRYTCYYTNVLSGVNYWKTFSTGFTENNFDYNNYHAVDLAKKISVSMHFEGSGGKYLLGGQNIDGQSSGNYDALTPIPIVSMQGYDYGCAQLRTPYLLPKDSTVIITIKNSDALRPITVGGCLFGLKIRV